ncbi:MAG: hypothetical protein HOP23_03250 [Methylococcaceae bacterium]|nr:hypothetical protein [Methylococcaceae bacterium]
MAHISKGISGFVNIINYAGLHINNRLGQRYSVLYVLVFFSVSLFSVSHYIGIALFNPDSWAYFELAKTVFTDNFYKFNTFRSYFSNEYSASFPFGYPVLIALAHHVVGLSPMVAVGVNICLAISTVWLIFKIGAVLQLPPISSFAIASGLLFFPGYSEEVLGGTAMPLAVLTFLAASYAWALRYPLIAGVLLGCAALVRFDYLIYGLLFQVAVCVVRKKKRSNSSYLFIGFWLGTLPWSIYSYSHFGKLWISDNSWVAMSALPAHVLDFPPAAVVSASDDPLMWITKLLVNFRYLIRAIKHSIINFPLVICLSVFVLANWFKIKTVVKLRVAVLFFILLVCMLPYILTGYMVNRYFSLLWLMTSFILFYATILIPPGGGILVGFHL